MSTEKGSARGLPAVSGGTTVMGLKHPASIIARIPSAKKPFSFADFIDNSLILLPLNGAKMREKNRARKPGRDDSKKEQGCGGESKRKKLNYDREVYNHT
jgi:hypothetical protein